MTIDNNLTAIREKIYQLRTAIMYNQSSELVKIPNSIVRAVNVDDQGYVWFVCKSPAYPVAQCETVFPVTLQFYNKEVSGRMEVSGIAQLVTNEYTSYFAAGEDGLQPLLFKLKMDKIEAMAAPGEKRKGKMESWLENGYRWFLRTAATSHPMKPNLSSLQTVQTY